MWLYGGFTTIEQGLWCVFGALGRICVPKRLRLVQHRCLLGVRVLKSFQVDSLGIPGLGAEGPFLGRTRRTP